MEDQVPFKVFMYWSEDAKPETRRFGLEKMVVTSFHYLNAKLQDIYPGLKTRSYTVTWKDEDGDDIAVSSDEELMTALTALHGNLIKLEIHVAAEDKEEFIDVLIGSGNANADGVDNMTHCTVTCDGCNVQVVGFRYKCTSCYDFDLCVKCEGQGMHPEHIMVRIPSPHMSRALIKSSIKRSRHFLKTVGHDAHKRRREHEHGARRHARGERPAPDHGPRRPLLNTWLETFTSYMNEFANLAGEPARQQPAATKPEPATTETGPTPAEFGPTPSRAESTDSGPNACPVMPGLENIPKLVEMYFNGSLASYLQNAGAASAPTPTDGPASASSSNVQADLDSAKDVEMGDAPPKPQDITLTQNSEPASAGEENLRDSSPDKADGWTMINKELSEESAKEQPIAPIGFNLPQEFQERMRLHDGQNLYPPLNVATAVMNPKEPECPREPIAPQPQQVPPQAPLKPQAPFAPQQPQAPFSPQAPQLPQAPFAPQAPQQPQAPQAPQPPQPQPQQQFRARHPLAHVDAAIQQMLAMGFTNEGGWLTKLLENKDGNIAAVIDLLTPPRSV